MSAPPSTAATERGLGNLLAQGTATAGRNIRARADAGTLVTLGVFPAVFVFGFLLLFGRLLGEQGVDYAQFLPPAIIVQWMFSVANSAAPMLAADRRDGLIARYRSMPVNRGALLVGRLLADTVWALVSVAVILLCGFVAGFRFGGGAAAALGFVALAVLFGLVLTAGTSAVGLASRDPESVSATLNLVYLPLLMMSTAFVPAEAFPDWLEPVIAASPVSVVIDALRALATGEDVAGAVAPALVWTAALGAVFSWAAVRSFRKAV